MLDFILSKFGIMLFAVAVAGILVMFSTEMKQIFVADEGMGLSAVMTKQIQEMANADSMCAFTYVILPKYIDVVGSAENPTPTSLYFSIDINVNNISDKTDKLVVFSLIDKRSKKVLSVDSFLTNNNTAFFNNNYGSNNNSMHIDPTKNNVLFLIKATKKDGNTTINFIKCKYSHENRLSDCYDKVKNDLSIGTGNSSGAFCVPRKDPFESIVKKGGS